MTMAERPVLISALQEVLHRTRGVVGMRRAPVARCMQNADIEHAGFGGGICQRQIFRNRSIGEALTVQCNLQLWYQESLRPPRRKDLHGIGYTGTYKAGNHAFRRFRNTHLRNRTACPEGLVKFWMGHADESMGDLYDKIKEDVAFRKEWAEKCGFGFNLPSVVPNVPIVPRNGEIDEAEKAA